MQHSRLRRNENTREVMSTDSSSSDEETSRLKEAVDSSLLKDDLYKKDFTEEKNEESKTPQSLRNQNHEVVTNNPFSLKVTPGFQKHVSLHLSKLLDKTIDDSEVFLKAKKKKRKKTSVAGVKLLFTSKKFLDASPGTDTCKHSGEKINAEEIDYEARAREVAVSPEWVLSKVEVKSWAPSFRDNVEVVQISSKKKKKKKKLNNGAVV